MKILIKWNNVKLIIKAENYDEDFEDFEASNSAQIWLL